METYHTVTKYPDGSKSEATLVKVNTIDVGARATPNNPLLVLVINGIAFAMPANSGHDLALAIEDASEHALQPL